MSLLKTLPLCAVLALAGCSSISIPELVLATAGQNAEMNQVREDYSAGQYGEVIRRVARSGEFDTAPKGMRVEAYKLQAFSYCMVGYEQLCEDGFGKIFSIDPEFELAPNEVGHPQWGPAYERAREARRSGGSVRGGRS